MIARRYVCLALLCLLTLVGCTDKVGVRMGIKPFSEQEILAEIVQRTLEDRGIAARPPYRCDDTYDCQRALESGYIDVMVEYTGTALHLLGAPEPTADVSAVEWLDGLYAPMGVRWVAPLGFDNGYVWLMPTAVASAAGTGTISDLDDWPRPLRMAVPPEYLRRPRDGLFATAERYGLQLADEPLVERDPLARYQAVLSGRADVAVGYATDANHAGLGLTRLRDDLDFFGGYQAVLIARNDALKREPALADTLRLLQGEVKPADMQRMNSAAAIGGEPPEVVARRFLTERELLVEPLEPARRTPLRVAVATEELERAYGMQALVAIRKVFEGRAVSMEQDARPLRAIRRGQARLGLVGAEAFFDLDRRGRLKRHRDVEAVAVLGRRIVHVIVPEQPGSVGLRGRVGVVRGSPAERITGRLLALSDVAGGQIEVRGSKQELLDDVAAGQLDAAVIMAPEGDPAVIGALRGDLTLASVPGWLGAERQFELPFLRPVRLRADAYPGLAGPVDTLASQVLLAGAAPTAGPGLAGGPAAALPAGSKPLGHEDALALTEALGIPEAPDPAVPSAWDGSGGAEAESPAQGWIDGALNAFVIGFLAWLVFVVIAPGGAGSVQRVPSDATAGGPEPSPIPNEAGDAAGKNDATDADSVEPVAALSTRPTR